MKTQETSTPQMDEIIFEKRNKIYGAYILRKMYNKQVNKALLFSVGILIAGLAYPLASSYKALEQGRYLINVYDPTNLTTVTPPEDPKQLPSLPLVKEPLARPRFIIPEVTNEVVIEETGLPNQDEFTNTTNEPVDIKYEQLAEKQPDIIPVPEVKQETFIDVQEMPSYLGGDTERRRFLADNIKYPQQASELGIQGTVYLQFVVDSKGNITESKILRGIGGGCEEEALRVVKMMPQWHPGRQNGKSVRVLYTMPVSFKLQG
ncbi:MAG: TonB family protein [Bacteroidales bacterium]|nr:TonB family protein [Bacteroidales bacterium]